MAKVTSKYQVTVPQVIAKQYGIRPGDDIEWIPAGDAIRVVRSGKKALPLDTQSKLRMFDEATERHSKQATHFAGKQPRNRGWTREDLYARGRSH